MTGCGCWERGELWFLGVYIRMLGSSPRGAPLSVSAMEACFWRAETLIFCVPDTMLMRGTWGHMGWARTRCQMASWPLQASARLMPFSAIQSISCSQRAQSHHTKE